jgi:pimeloyl-ACP methyl ester carboxylesterase
MQHVPVICGANLALQWRFIDLKRIATNQERDCLGNIRILHGHDPTRERRPGTVLATALMVALFTPLRGHARAWHGTMRSSAHVYLLRGLMNVFSLGMDELAAKVRAQGIVATVHNYSEFEALADEAVRNHKAGEEGPIIIIGHSLGADAAVYMANRLGALGVPVKLVVPLDPVDPTAAGSNIARVVNLYISDGVGRSVSRGPGFRGVLENIDLKGRTDVGHISIDKSSRLHQQVLGYVLDAVHSTRQGAPARLVRTPHHHHSRDAGETAPIEPPEGLKTTSAIGHESP